MSKSAGRSIDQAVSRRLPTVVARVWFQVVWDLWWTKCHWDRFSGSNSASPANSHSTNCFIKYLSIYLYGSTVILLDLGRFFSFLIYTQLVGLLGREISPSQGRYLRREQKKTQNKRTQTSMPWVGFESTIPPFERAKTVHALDRAATVIGSVNK
jgi:hypothetical protein